MPTGTYTADASISTRRFTVSAVIVGNHLRHYRSRDHTGTQDDTTVTLSTAIGQYAAGTTLHDVLVSLNDRLNGVLSTNTRAGAFQIDAFVLPTFRANAVFFKAQAGSYTADARMAYGSTFTVDGVLKGSESGSLTVDASMV